MPFGVKDDTGMARELVRTFWWPVPRKIIRTGHHDAARLEQAPPSERGIDDGPAPNRNVESFSDNTGTLKMWNAERGYGFIADDSGGPDIFLHVIALLSAGIDPDKIRKGERLTFDVESTRDGRTRASNVRGSG